MAMWGKVKTIADLIHLIFSAHAKARRLCDRDEQWWQICFRFLRQSWKCWVPQTPETLAVPSLFL